MSETTPHLSADAPAALPAGTRVAEFEIRRLLGSGGFGIVYLAWDHALEREVALKEYMPGTLAGRGAGLQVSVRSQSTADTFALGLRSFINEARLLARFDHPSLVKVYRFWEDNGTAYMVMPYYPGRTLRQVRQGMVMPPSEGACRRVLDALLSALETLHREGVYHRDIAPDNILLGDDGLPVLLDFGAARRVLNDRTQALTSIMKPHYAPLEQYADANAMRQGPWTDLYALGGTMYFLITSEEPVAAASRALHDDQPRLAELRPRDCSPGFLAALDWMLALKPLERPQSVHMLRDVIEGRITLPGRKAADRTVPGVASRHDSSFDSVPRTDFDPSEAGDLDAAAEAATAASAAAITIVQAHSSTALTPAAPDRDSKPPSYAAPSTAPQASVPPSIAAPAAPATRQSPQMLGLLAILLVLNLLAWWWFTRGNTSAPAAAPSAAAATTAPAAPTKATAANALPTAAVAAPAIPAATAVRSDKTDAAEAVAGETILSVLPARAPARTAAASGAAPRAAAGAASGAVSLPRPVDAAASAPAIAARVRNPSTEAAASVPAMSVALQSGPRARCGDRNFLSMLICVKRECDNPSLQAHPECVKLREQEEAQRSRRE